MATSGGGGLWYAVALGGAALVGAAPLYLARPAAMLLFALAILLNGFVTAPAGWAWFVPLYLAKLLLAHAVREEPYRPRLGV